MATLEQQLDALIAEHRLSSITLTRIARDDGTCFWEISPRGDGICVNSYGSQDLGAAEGLALAIVRLNAHRPPPVAAPELAGVA